MARKKPYATETSAAIAAGWTVIERNGSIIFRPPAQPGQVVAHSTESDHRAVKNTRSRLRRLGLAL